MMCGSKESSKTVIFEFRTARPKRRESDSDFGWKRSAEDAKSKSMGFSERRDG